IAPGRLRLLEDGPLAAVVSAVPLSVFGEEPLAERLNDRTWLEAHAREHEDVLRRVGADSTVVPFRFGVIYRDLADVAAMLRERQTELTSALERVRGRIEVGVKVWADGGQAEAPPAGQTAEGAGGRAYLERRLGEQLRTKQRGEQLGEIARAAHERLLRHAD